jgi:hypothetical protein
VRSIVKYVAVMCLFLTSWSAMALVAHHHAKGTESVCTVCVAAHSAAPTVAATLLHATFAPLLTLRAEPVSAKGRLVAFALSVRPPPAV